MLLYLKHKKKDVPGRQKSLGQLCMGDAKEKNNIFIQDFCEDKTDL
jgi:hypothetical protein